MGTRLNIPMRGLLENVVKTLEKFKDIGSAAASLDPIHAGLPWASICVLLPLVLNLSSQEHAANSGLDKISMILARYSAMESVHSHQDNIKLTMTVENALVDLYAKILEYQAVAGCFFSKRTLARYGRAVPKFDDFIGILKEVEDLDNDCTKLIKYLKLESILDKAEEMLAKLQSQSNMNEKAIQWLSGVNYGVDHDRARQKLGSTYTKTGQWLLQGTSYLNWKYDGCLSPSAFWLRGPVGTGKTSLTSIVIQEHLEELKASAQERLAYFYCSEREQPPTTSLEVIRSLLAQLSWNSDGVTIADAVKGLYTSANHISGAGRPDIEQCLDLVQIVASACPKVTIIIDALDECADSWTLLSSLEIVGKRLQNNIALFVSSRMNVAVSEYFPQCITIGPESNTGDIENYIQTEMAIPHQRLLEGNHSRLEQRLARVLTARSENMYVVYFMI